jgi:hypothetical protein
VSRSVEPLRDVVTAVRGQLVGLTRQSERTLLLGTILLASTVSAVTGYVLTQYYSVNVLSSLVYFGNECWRWREWGAESVGLHCFGDYASVVVAVMRPNPWAGFDPLPSWLPNSYPAAAMVPYAIFGFVGKWLGAWRLGLFGYQFALTTAVLSPALWAARGARGLERVVVFVACGAAAIPAWVAVDRGNSTGFVVPIALVFLVALYRRHWGLVTIMVVLAMLIKPQFALLAVALFAARKWRLGGIGVAGGVMSNLAAYLLWPRDFPATIAQSIRNSVGYGFHGFFQFQAVNYNISFSKGLLLIPDWIKARGMGGKIPDGFLAGPRSLIGYGVLALVVVAVLALGRRIPPVMVGIVLLATASLFPALVYHYYLVFVLPVAALVARDPDGPPGSGIFDRLGDRRRAVGICVSLAAALSIAQVALPSPPISVQTAGPPLMGNAPTNTTVMLAPLLWLVTCAVIIVSYARRPAPGAGADAASSSPSGVSAPAAVPQSVAAVNTDTR